MMCVYCNCQQLDTLSTRYPWLLGIVIITACNRMVKYLTGYPHLLLTLTDLTSHDISLFTGLLITSLIKCHIDKMIGGHGDETPSPDIIVSMVKNVRLGEAKIVQCMRSVALYNVISYIVME